MSSTHSFLFAVFEGAAVVFILLGLPLLRRHLVRSDFYARWSPSALRDAAVWRAINAATGRDFIAIGATLSALAIGLWMMGARPEVFALACAGWVLLGATGVMLHSFVLVVQHHAERASKSTR
jgi:hypothetical protein